MKTNTHQPEGLRIGQYVAIDLDENNAHIYPGKTTNFGWGVCKHGSGLQVAFLAREQAEAEVAYLNAS